MAIGGGVQPVDDLGGDVHGGLEADTELVKEFFLAFTRWGGITLHLRQLAGENSHHIIEAAFKGVGRALRQALAQDPAFQGQAASSKGTLV